MTAAASTRHALAILFGLLAVLGLARDAPAQAGSEEFERAVTALAAKQHSAAILELEALADAGVLHPDVSYNRGLAYALRVKTSEAEPGDLGRAAAAFEEAVRLSPTDRDAERALDLVRAEVARRRSRQDKNDVIVRPSLDRVVIALLSPTTWSICAIAASLAFAVGLLMRWRKSGWLHITGAVLAPLALFAVLVLGPIAFFARSHAATRKPGVIVLPEASLEADQGNSSDAPAIPEATLVELGERKGDEVLVRWGSYEGWLPARAVRVIAVR